MSVLRRVAFATSIVAATACDDPPPARAPASAPSPTAPIPVASSAPTGAIGPASTSPAVRVVYEGEAAAPWPTSTSLQIDAVDRSGASLLVSTGAAREWVDLRTGQATPWSAKTTSPEKEMQIAEPLEHSTSPFGRSPGFLGHTLIGDWLFVSENDALFAMPRSGGARTLLSKGLDAAYGPVASADGSTVAFQGAVVRAVIPPGAFHRAVYSLYFLDRPFVGKAPRRVDAVRWPRLPHFAPSGDVYVMSSDVDHDDPTPNDDHGGCLYRVRPRDGAPTKLFCITDLRGVDFSLSPNGAHGVISGVRSTDHGAELVLEWVPIPGDAVRGAPMARPVPQTGPARATLSDEGFFIDGRTAVEVLDLPNGTRASLPPDGWQYVYFASWKDGHTATALRVTPNTKRFQIVTIDARMVLWR